MNEKERAIFWHSASGRAILALLVFMAVFLVFLAREYSESNKNYSGIQIENSQAVAEKIRTGFKHDADLLQHS